MEWFEALILGIIQGLTEYLPVSSSGHLAIGSALFGIEGEENLAFTVVVHVATVFSTLVVLWKEIEWIFKGLFKLQMNGTPVSSGMGTCGFVGQIGVYSGWVADIANGTKTAITGFDWAGLILISFILPAVICPLINMLLKKIGWVKDGDMKLS